MKIQMKLNFPTFCATFRFSPWWRCIDTYFFVRDDDEFGWVLIARMQIAQLPYQPSVWPVEIKLKKKMKFVRCYALGGSLHLIEKQRQLAISLDPTIVRNRNLNIKWKSRHTHLIITFKWNLHLPRSLLYFGIFIFQYLHDQTESQFQNSILQCTWTRNLKYILKWESLLFRHLGTTPSSELTVRYFVNWIVASVRHTPMQYVVCWLLFQSLNQTRSAWCTNLGSFDRTLRQASIKRGEIGNRKGKRSAHVYYWARSRTQRRDQEILYTER